VALDHRTLQAQEHRSSVLGVVVRPGQGLQGRAQQPASQHGPRRRPGGPADLPHEPFGHRFSGLEDQVPRESVADGHVHLGAEESGGFDVPHEVQARGLEHGGGRGHQAVALPLLGTQREQSHPRVGPVQHQSGVDRTHQGELEQPFGATVHVGPHVQGQRGLRLGGKDHRQGRALDPRQAAHSGQRHLVQCRRIPCAHEGLGLAVAHHVGGQDHRGPLALAQGGPCRVGHGDGFVGVHHLDRARRGLGSQ